MMKVGSMCQCYRHMASLNRIDMSGHSSGMTWRVGCGKTIDIDNSCTFLLVDVWLYWFPFDDICRDIDVWLYVFLLMDT